MFIEITEVIRVKKDIYGSEDIYYPEDIIEVEYREEASAVLPKYAIGRFDAIRNELIEGGQFLHLDVSDKYRFNTILIPVDGIKNIRRIEK